MKLTGAILAKNEEQNIKQAIESLFFCDEVIVIDDNSIDKTRVIAIEAGARVVKRTLSEDFAAQRNFAFHVSYGDWVLFIDADEVVSKKLAKEIMNTLKRDAGKKSAYRIKRRDWWRGREIRYGEVLTARLYGLTRLVKRNSGKWTSSVHEEFQAIGSVGKLNAFLDHFPHPTVKEFLEEINFYSSLRAKELQRRGAHFSLIECIFTPFSKFIYTYGILLGFLDGSAGFIYSFMMSFHSFLVRAKLYQYTQIAKS